MSKKLKAPSKPSPKKVGSKADGQAQAPVQAAEPSLPYTSLTSIHNYIEYVRQHYKNVDEIIFPLIGIIIWKSSNKVQVQVKGRYSENTLLNFHLGLLNQKGAGYFLSYNEHEKCFDISKGSEDGVVLLQIDNNTPVNKLVKHLNAARLNLYHGKRESENLLLR